MNTAHWIFVDLTLLFYVGNYYFVVVSDILYLLGLIGITILLYGYVSVVANACILQH